MKQDKHADKLEDELVYICKLKSNLEKRYQRVFEGIANHGDSTLLNKIYTDLYITQGGGEQINTEHEVRQIEITSRHRETSETQIEFNNMFNPLERDQNIRTVLTKGVAGIGKSVSVQKFVLDWAEGKENKDINFIFPLPFRELNLKDKERVSLMDLIGQFFPEVKRMDLTRKKVLFIFDGLDECRLPLKFDSNEMLRDVTSPASLDVLLTNLIKGNLFPSALIWITTRPAAAGKIPPECIDRVTEVRGFNDAQKEEYFRKRFTDENMANTIIDHVKKSKSLFIMCHIPVFCWISATVLQNILEKKRNDQSDDTTTTSEDTPKTLTQMYTHFFRFQIQQSRRKYEGEYSPDISWDKDVILSLGKLAFQNLERSNLIFYDSDLEACGIDITKASVYSGMCTQIFKQETGMILGSVYCFVHLSIQEFTAALYAHLFLDINKKNVFVQEHTENNSETMIGLLKTAVDKALESDNGHLDLFLRFLLGLSLESNRPLLRGLLTQEESNEQSNKMIVEYIKQKFEDNSSAERSINLFYCLNELNDQSLVEEIQKHLREGSLSSADLSPAQWSALAFVLLTSEEELEEFELQKFKKSDECLIRLSPVVKTAKKALLNDCNLTDKGCSAIAKVLGSDSHLTEVNMSDNKLKDSGVKLLCDGLKNTNCELKILRLIKCELTEESCSALSTVLSSDSISLKELDLSNNNLQDSGVKLLSDGLMNVKCGLEILRLSDCSIGEEGYVALCSAVRSNPSHLIELDLSGNDPGESGVKLIYDLIQDQDCALKKVRFLKSSSAAEVFKYLSETLGINPLLQRELNLNDHKLNNTRVKQICDLLKDKHCRLNTLRLSDCSIGEEGYVALSRAVRSNPSHLTELDLSGNDPGESGVKLIHDLIQDQNCALKKVRLLKSRLAEAAHQYLNKVVDKEILLKRKLNLNDHKLQDSRLIQICDLLKDKHCRLNKLILSGCGLTEESCSALASVLISKPGLKELDMSNNYLQDSGVKKLHNGLENTNCQLHKLRLSDCSIEEGGYESLSKAVRSNPSHLTELDLSGNDPGESGVKLIYDLIQDQNCALKKVRFLKSSSAVEGFKYLSETLGINPLLQRDLNLNDHKLNNTRVKQICDLLKDKHCRLNTLRLNKSCITSEGCADLMSGFILNPSHIRYLDLSGNKLENSGIKKISHLLTNPQCRLKELKLSDCSIGEEGYEALCSAVRSNPSHLTELDLSGNDPGESGVKLIYDLIQDQNCALNTVRLLKSRAAEEACVYLNEVLDVHPLLVKELNLSDNKLGDLDGEKLSALLMDSHSKVKKIILNDCELTEKQCSAVAALLSCVKEIEMNNSRLMGSGLKQICDELKKPQCQLQILKLSDCSIGEDGYVDLCSAVRSNPSHLIELDLSGNDPGESGVKLIYDLIQDQNCALKTVTLLKSHSAEEARQYLNGVVDKEILLQRDLNLNDHKLNNTRVKQICDLLKDKHCRLNTLRLSGCGLTEESCSALASVLISKSGLKELDMSNNNLQDSGVKKLHNGLENTNCQLHKLGLSCCSIEEGGYESLSKAVKSNPSHLIELDLSGNNPGESGVKLIYDLIQDPKCALKKVRFLKSSSAVEVFKYLSETLGINPLLQRDLNLNDHKLNNTRVKQICDLLKDKHCRLNTLKLNNSCITAEGFADLMSGFNSNPSHIIHLDLSGNKLEHSGMKKISDLLTNPQCRLMELKLSDCSIGEEGYVALCSAVRSNPSHLIELDLSGNDPGESGVKLIYDLIQDQNCALKKVRLLKSDAAEEACVYLNKVLDVHPLLVKELNLSDNKLGDLDGEKLSALLMDSHSKVKKIILNDCELTEKQCSAVAALLSCVKEIEMNNSRLMDSGVKQICDELKNPQCQLQRLKLSDCSIGEEGYDALCSAVRSNPSHLIELDLSGNDPGESGVKLIYDLIQDQNCALKTVRLLKSRSAEAAHQYLNKVVDKEILLKRKLNLNDHKLQDSRLIQICDLLKDKHCRLNTLILSGCGLTKESCSALASVLRSKPGLKELDMSNNNLQDSGVKKLHNGLQNTNCQLHKLRLSDCSIGEEGYVALCSAVRSNPSHLTELDLSGNDPGESGVKLIYDLIQDQNCALKKVRLLQSHSAEEAHQYLNGVVGKEILLQRELNLNNHKLQDSRLLQICDLLKDKHCRLNTLILSGCGLTEESCSALASVLRSKPGLKELDMSNNNLQDSGVKKLHNGLENTNCQLHKLRLSDCSIGEEGYVALSRAVRSNPSHLIELDLSGNDPGESGVKHIYDLIQDPKCALKKVRLLQSRSAEEAHQYLNKVVGKEILLQRDLNLNDHKLQDSRLLQICDLLKDKHCRLNTLILSGCGLTEESCSALASVLRSKPGLKELDMSNNNLQDSGVKKLHNGLENTNCQLQKLRLSDCSIGEEGYVALSKALRSNPSHLIELDLRGNDPGESGVKHIYDLIQDQDCALKKVRFVKSRGAEEACFYLNQVLDVHPLLLKELNLSDNKLGDLDGEKLSALLMDSHSKVKKIILNDCELTEKQCSAVAALLSCVKEIEMNNSRLMDSGVKQICDELKKPQCQLQILKLSDCSIGAAGYVALSGAVRSNPSHLIELDLSGNDPGESGVKLIYQLIQVHKCALKKVRLLKSHAAEEACVYLRKVLKENPLLLDELDLSDNKLGDLDGEKLSALLMDSHSKVKKIILNDCELTEKQCSAVAALLSCVKEIEMNNSRLMDSGVKQICDELKKPQCQLQKLRLSDCSIGAEGYVALSRAVRSNPSHLTELDLSGNNPGESGVKLIYDLIQDHKYALKEVRFFKKSSSADEGFKYLSETLGINPLLQRDLNLNDHKLNNTRVKQICDLLKDKHCRLNTLMLKACDFTDEDFSVLASALNSNPSHLRHLNLSGNKLGDSGVNHLCDLLKNSQFKLETLELCKCSIKYTRRDKLISALCSNLSHLKELNLSGNKIKDSGVKHLCDLLRHSDCNLEKLYLNKCKITDVDSLAETLAITKKLKILDLSNNTINSSSLNLLREVLKSSKCELRLETKFWFSWGFKMLWGEQSSSDEEDEDTLSQNST
nr:uncharacterized protein LOC129452683 isoform X2 [Misgurnus anguillicaudatus]